MGIEEEKKRSKNGMGKVWTSEGKKWSKCVMGEKKREMGEVVVGHVCGGEKGWPKKRKKIGGGDNPLYNM